MYEANYDELAKAIVEQAVKDYVRELKKYVRLLDRCASKGEIETQLRIIKGQEHFFHSQWYECLTDLDADKLLEAVRNMVCLPSEPIELHTSTITIKPEVLVKDVCPEDCIYREKHGSITCNYCIMTGDPRGCDIGKDCIRYRRPKAERKSSRVQTTEKITHRPDEDREFFGYKREVVNRVIGNNHRSGRK